MQYLITEATCIKVNREDAKAQEAAEKAAEMKRKKAEAKEMLKRVVR